MFVEIILGCCALIIGAFVVNRRLSAHSLLPCAPSDEASFFWGHELRVFNGEIGSEFLRWTNTLGPIFKINGAMRLFRGDTIILASSYAANHVFQNAYDYNMSESFKPLVVKTAGHGIITVHGDEHRSLRKMVSHAFSPSALKGMVDDAVKCADKAVLRLHDDLAEDETTVVNLNLYMSACTLETISLVGFGRNFGHTSDESKAIGESWRGDVQIMSSFTGFLAPVIIDLFPWLMKLPIPAITEDGVAKKIIQVIGRKMLHESKTDEHETNILALLAKDGALTEEQMLNNIASFVMAGHETTAGTAGVTLYELARRPDLQSRLRTEIEGVDLSNFDRLDKLEFLDAVIREALRIHPAGLSEKCQASDAYYGTYQTRLNGTSINLIWFLVIFRHHDTERIAAKDDVIPLQNPITLRNGQTTSNLHIKAGDRILIPFTVLNTDPAVWGPEAAEFKPERWLIPGGVPPSNLLPHGPYGRISSFADGPRVCIGWRLAILELKVIVSSFVRAFEFSDSGPKIEMKFAPVLQTFVDGKASQLPVHVRPL